MESKGESLAVPPLSGASENTQSLDVAEPTPNPRPQHNSPPLEHKEDSDTERPRDSRAAVVIMPDGNIVPVSSAAALLPSVHRTDIGSIEQLHWPAAPHSGNTSATKFPQEAPLPPKPDAAPGPAPSGLRQAPISQKPASPHLSGAPGPAPEPGNQDSSQGYSSLADTPILGPAPDQVPRKLNMPVPGPAPERYSQNGSAQHMNFAARPTSRSPSPQPYPQYQLSPSQYRPHHLPSAVQYTVSGPTTPYGRYEQPHPQTTEGTYSQQRYFQPQGYQQPVIVPSGPTTPVGYVLSDLFNRINTLTFIPSTDVSGRPLAVCRSAAGNPTVRCGGSYVRKESEFVVEAVEQGVVVLRNNEHGHMAVNDAKKVFVFRTPYKQGEIMFEFVIRSVSGAVVAFESLKFPGHYLSVGKDGLVKLEQHSLESENVQFTVRVNTFNGFYSQVIMSPFAVGKPSVFNQLKERSVIQLYHKRTMTFLCLKKGGKVKGIQKDDNGTFLIYCDRGMGRVSLKSYYTDLLKLRMTTGGKMSSVGAEDINADFYVKENQNGTIQFESVALPGKYVHMFYEQNKELCEFSVFQVDMSRNLGKDKIILRFPLN